MGNLIRFESRRRIIPGQNLPKGDSEVLIFTGVRYERFGDTEPAPAADKARKPATLRKRKRS